MASLQTPLTIIPDRGNSNENHPFRHPAATWYDEDPLHFVALEARRNRSGSFADLDGDSRLPRNSVISGVGSVDSGKTDDEEHQSEVVTYHAFALPKECRSRRAKDDADQNSDEGFSRDASTPIEPMSAFDAAKKVAQESLKSLNVDISVSFPLPLELATEVGRSSSVTVDDDDLRSFATYTTDTMAPSRRIPILAKFSPKMGNMRFLALQYTPTYVRVATVEGGGATGGNPTRMGAPAAKHTEDNETTHWDHWTIDLSYAGAQPVASKPEVIPMLKRNSGYKMFGKKEEGIEPGTTSIIGGGILWNGRGNQDNIISLDLVLVTATSVIVYNINTVKKQLTKTRVFPHDLAASFWFEPLTRTLLIGSYKRNQNSNVGNMQPTRKSSSFDDSVSIYSTDDSEFHPHGGSIKSTSVQYPSTVMVMKTFFFSKDSVIVEMLPIFAVGTLRVQHDEDERHELMLAGDYSGNKAENLPQRAFVLPTDIFLVCMYDEVYCVELGSLGSGQGLGLIKLDKEARCIHVRHIQPPFPKMQKKYGADGEQDSSISGGVIDNLFCIFSKRDETTYFLDVADIFSDDERIFRECVKRHEPSVHDERLSFLAPEYFLDTSGQGTLYQVVINLPLVLENVPPTACIIPLLLRRNIPRATIRDLVMERFSSLIWKEDMPTLQKWIGVIVDKYYSSSDFAAKFDFEPNASLLSKSSLISFDGAKNTDDVDHIVVPESCVEVLTQKEFLQMILLPHAIAAIKKQDARKLEFISSLTVHYFVQLESRFALSSILPLQCLVVALLWRTGGNAELRSFLLAQQYQWTIAKRRKQPNLASAKQTHFDNPEFISFAEKLFIIATTEVSDKASVRCGSSTANQLMSHATIILLGCGAAPVAVKYLLSAGQVNGAINICLKKIGPRKGDVKLVEGTSPKHFFRAAVSNAKKQSLSDRCKSFNHLHCFLRQWDPSCFALDSRKAKVLRSRSKEGHRRRTSFKDVDTVVVEQSVFAHDCPRFPDELFGGKNSVFCQKLRAMFGYAHNVKK